MQLLGGTFGLLLGFQLTLGARGEHGGGFSRAVALARHKHSLSGFQQANALNLTVNRRFARLRCRTAIASDSPCGVR